MIKELFKYIASIPAKILKKSDVEIELDSIYSNIRLAITPVIDSIKSVMVKKSDLKLADIPFFKGTIIEKEFKSVNVLLVEISKVVSEVEKKRKDIEALLKDIPNNMSTKGMTTNQALLLNITDNLKFFTEVTSDILTIILESYNNTSDSVFNDSVLKQKKTLLYDYYNIMSSYIDMNKSIVDLGNIVITNNQAVATILADSNIVIPTRLDIEKGFRGNPITHAGFWFQDKKREYLQRTIKNKEYAELLLAEYELRQVNQYDPKLEKLIEGAKDTINEYEVKIEKLKVG